MKRIIYVMLAVAAFAGLMVPLSAAQSQTQSLGDYARAVRKQKDKNKDQDAQVKQYDNDNLPRTPGISIVGTAAPDHGDNSASQSSSSQAGGQPGAGDSGKASLPATQSGKDRQKMYDDWKTKIQVQKDKLDLASRELDVLQREYKLRAAAFYADAGNRLRNSGEWDKEDAQYKQQLAEKQKAVDDAKKQLEDIQEQARKAGAPASTRE